MPNTWFTGDSHFGHKNMVKGVSAWPDKSACRDFQSIEEMNDQLVLASIQWFVPMMFCIILAIGILVGLRTCENFVTEFIANLFILFLAITILIIIKYLLAPWLIILVPLFLTGKS